MAGHDREKNVESYIRAKLNELDLMVLKFLPDHSNGMPDRVVLLPGGRVVWVELKTEGGRLSEIQKYQHEILRSHGQEVVVVWNKEQVGELVWRIQQECQGS